MKKVPTLFLRDFAGNPKFVLRDINPSCQWVADGEGVATRKYDGTCCAIINGVFLKRYEVRKGKAPPQGFIPADEVDQQTGKQPGWLPVLDGPEDKWHREAFGWLGNRADGTFELVGPKIQGNPERFSTHHLVRHSHADKCEDAPRDFDGLRAWLELRVYEGLVWHNQDGRMAKIKRRDFDFAR